MNKKLLIIFGLLIALITSTKAQVSGYSFTQFSDTYVAVTGGTVFGNTTSDNQRFVDPSIPLGGTGLTGVGIPIGFNFTYNGSVFDVIAINNNGWITFGQSTLTPNAVNMTSATYNNAISVTSSAPAVLQNRIAGLATDLQAQAGAELRVQTLGVTPNQTFVVQFTNYRRASATGDSYNFQIRLSETSNNVNIIYGGFTSAAASTAQVGLRGIANTDYNNRITNASNIWSSSIPGTANNSAVNFNTTLAPASGQNYQWSPPPLCSGTPNSGTAVISSSLGCPSLNFNLTATGLTNALGLTYQWQSAPSSSGPWASITTATNIAYSTSTTSTTYYQMVTTCTASALSATTSIVSYSVSSCYYMNNTTVTACSGSIFDSGGPTANYLNNESYTLTLVPSTPNAMAVLTFTSFNTEATYDFLYIYDGNSTSSPLIGQYTGVMLPPVITATNNTGILTLKFTSDGSTTDPGFEAAISCYLPPTCSGMPASGTGSISLASGCPNTLFNLSATGITTGLGLTYQWQSSPSASGPWTSISNATTTAYTTSVATTTYFQLQTTCTVSALSATTSIVSYSIVNPGPCVCNTYASSGATSTSDTEMLNVTFDALNNTSSCASVGPGPGSSQNEYSNYAGFLAAPTVTQGQTVSFTVQVGTCGGSYNNATAIYIDYNQNGSFADPGEQAYLSSASTVGPHFEIGSVTLPITANVGNTRMRVIVMETSTPSAILPTGGFSWGETEDYCINIALSTLCSGAPASGTAAISQTSGCPNIAFNLSATGLTSASGITYQWQSAPSASGPWTSVPNATTSAYSTTAAAITFYQMVTTCTVSSQSATTSVVSYTPTGPCYSMSNSTITTCSGSLFDSGGPNSNYLNNENYTLTLVPSTPNAMASLTFTSFNTEATYDFLYIYDGNSTSSPLIGQYTGVTLPPVITATNASGILTLKFTSDFSNTDPGFEAAISCYIPPTCSGMPSSGTSTVSSLSGCSNVAFNLSASGISTGLGIQYQWQSAPSASGPWTSVPNATMSAYSTSATAITFYQMVTTCTVSSQSATTSVTSYTPTGPCYNMSTTTITTCSGTIYDSGGPTANYQNNESYTMTLLPATVNNMVSLSFISFHTEPGFDTLFIYDGNSTNSALIGQFSGTTLPPVITATNITGAITLFFKSDYSVNYSGWEASVSCYLPPTCAGMPSSGVTSISSPTGCPTAQFTISATGISTGLGISYQWQSAPSASGPWASIPSATNNAYITSTSTTTYYQMVTTCSVSALSATTSISSYSIVNPGPCVCNNYGISSALYSYDEDIWNVSFGTLSNTSNCTIPAPGPGSILNQYGNYSGFVSAPTVLQGQSVPFSIDINTCGGFYGVDFDIYIDYNQNGLFTDPGELVYTISNANQGPNTGTILIPNTTAVGITRMRVVAVEGTVPGPTGTYYEGETEDYCIDIQIPVPCAGTPNSGIATISTPTGCITDVFNLSATGITNAIGITYQWQSAPSASGPWANIATATNVAYSTSTATTTYFQMVTTCSNSALSATTSVVSYSPFNCYTMSNTTITTCGSTLYDSGGLNNNYQNNEDYTLTIVPSTANASVNITFNSYASEAGYDFLYVYDGNSTAAPLIGTYDSNNPPPASITGSSPGGELTLEFTSDFSNTDTGFDISITCTSTCAGPPSAPAASGATICSGNSTTLTTVVTGTAQWFASSTSTVPIATGTLFTTPILNNTTTYFVRDTAACGPSTLTPVTVTVIPTPTLIASASSSAICAGHSATLTASGTDTYSWSTTATTSVIVVTPTATTNYTVTGYGIACNVTQTVNVNLVVNPTPTVSLTASGITTICAINGSIALVGSPNGGVYSGVGVTNNLLSIANPGIFTPMYSYTNSITGCTNSAVTSVTVVNCSVGTGIGKQSTATGLSVMPNPNSGIFTIETNSSLVKNIELTDIAGRIVYTASSDLATIQVNINDLANGVYYLKVVSLNGTNIIKVIKQ